MLIFLLLKFKGGECVWFLWTGSGWTAESDWKTGQWRMLSEQWSSTSNSSQCERCGRRRPAAVYGRRVCHLLPAVPKGVPKQRDGLESMLVWQRFESRLGWQLVYIRRAAQIQCPLRPALHLPLDGEFIYLVFFSYFLSHLHTNTKNTFHPLASKHTQTKLPSCRVQSPSSSSSRRKRELWSFPTACHTCPRVRHLHRLVASYRRVLPTSFTLLTNQYWYLTLFFICRPSLQSFFYAPNNNFPKPQRRPLFDTLIRCFDWFCGTPLDCVTCVQCLFASAFLILLHCLKLKKKNKKIPRNNEMQST